jgi:hypothetical protein
MHGSLPKYEESNQSLAAHSPSASHSPSIVEAHDFIQHELNAGRHMEADRIAVLSSAMSFIRHISHTSKPIAPLLMRESGDGDILDGITYPSMELLYWILRGTFLSANFLSTVLIHMLELKSNSIGPYVLDYFKHVSPNSLRVMGLALINRDGSPETLLFSSICANSVAFKFINTILSADPLQGMDQGLRDCADRHRKSIQIAVNRMPLLAAPSMLFLQALLCSVCYFSLQVLNTSTDPDYSRHLSHKALVNLCLAGHLSPRLVESVKTSVWRKKLKSVRASWIWTHRSYTTASPGATFSIRTTQ